MKSKRSLFWSWMAIILVCLLLSACAGESARYKSQADQFLAEGHLAEAVLTYRQALITHPDDPDLLHGLGMSLAAQGRGRSAEAALERAAALQPADASTQSRAGEVDHPSSGRPVPDPGMDLRECELQNRSAQPLPREGFSSLMQMGACVRWTRPQAGTCGNSRRRLR